MNKLDGEIEAPLFTMDKDSPWTFDRFSSFVTSSSPSDRPLSPLWSFSDNRPPAIANAGGLDSTTESQLPDGDIRSPTPPILGFMPLESADGSDLIKQRIQYALKYLECSDARILAQLWVPVKNGDRYLLTTAGQPFFLNPKAHDLHRCRMVSLMYAFSIDEESDGDLEPVGRVFRQKLPEWTPCVQYYSSKKYPRLNDAIQYSVRGTLALTLFESSGHSCVGVLELIMKSEKSSYTSEADKVCEALEAVSMKSSVIVNHQTIQLCHQRLENAPAEIMRVIKRVCEIHKLPLAQTWVSCRHISIVAKVSVFDGSFVGHVCMSTTDTFYITNPLMWAFRQACEEHRLLKGQGVVGKAFLSKSACFCEDIIQISKFEYPLVHYARKFGLSSSFAIYVSSDTADEEYVLEFFLPPSIRSSVERESFLETLLVTMDKNFRSLKAVNFRSSEIFDYPITQENPSNEDTVVFSAEHNEVALPCLDERVILAEEERDNEVRVQVPESSARNIVETTTVLIPPITEISQNERQVDTVASKQNGDPKSSSQRVYRTGKLSSKDIEQHFGKKLEDAAKNLGVSVSTLKRACRANGIERWPSHKRNKVKSSPSNFNHKFDKHVGDGEPSSSNPRPMYTTGVADKPYHSPPRWVTVKATCGVDIIRFRLSTSSFTMADLLRNITRRLPLTEGSFKIKYEDDYGHWILIACDEDIEECIRLLNEENSIINMSLVPL